MKTAELVKKCQDRMKSIRDKIENKRKSKKVYSEEDLREAFRQGENNVGYNSKYSYTFKLTEKEWFEKFKNK
jgi:hypothetical protein